MPGTIKENPDFDVEKACKKLKKAMKGFGSNHKDIIEVLTSHDNKQRQEIKKYYETAYGKDLIKELKSELTGDLEVAIVGLLKTTVEWDAYWTKKSMKGLGTDESALIEIFAGKDLPEIEAIKAQYLKENGEELKKELEDELSGDLYKLMKGIIECEGEAAGEVNVDRAIADARALNAASRELGTNEETFITIFNTRAFPQLRETFTQFQNLTQTSIEECIQTEFSGHMKEALLTIVARVRDELNYYVDRLHNSMKGMGTDEKTLTRVLIARCEIDLVEIKEKYEEKYNKSLRATVKDDVTGDYKKVLSKIIGK